MLPYIRDTMITISFYVKKMNNKSKIWGNCLKTCTSIALIFSAIISTESITTALPTYIPLPQSNPNSIRNYDGITSPTPPPSLNVTPNPLRQNYSGYDRRSSSYYYSDYRDNSIRRRRNRYYNKTLVNPTIINSEVYNSVIIDPVIINPTERYYTSPDSNDSYIRIIRYR